MTPRKVSLAVVFKPLGLGREVGAGDDVDVAVIIEDYVAKLGASKVPKLLFWAKPGAIVPEETVRLCEARFANLETVFLGESGHYIAEDFPHEIGEKVAAWVKGFG